MKNNLLSLRTSLGSILFVGDGPIDMGGGYTWRRARPGTTSPAHPDDTTGDQMRYGFLAGRLGRIFGSPVIVTDGHSDRALRERMEHDA